MTEKEIEETDNAGNETKSNLLLPQEKYLEAGCHIGTKFKNGSMKEFIYRRRRDRLFVMDISKIDEQLRKAAEKLAEYEPKDIVVTAVRAYANAASSKMSLILGTKVISKRFIPGSFTNTQIKYFVEPEILLVCDPKAEAEAIREANIMKVPVISLADTENDTKGIDVVIPCNNKGKRSLALVFYILTREYMMKKGMIKTYSDFKYKPRDFEDLDAVSEYEQFVQDEETVETPPEEEKKVEEPEQKPEAPKEEKIVKKRQTKKRD
ncbi:30S ribosomal protein S2 [Candidatus Micrarchaeota archaeon]|jgi:small subunit ribosomal protein S2|nr:30S ribosomal protein S2 [Candidatus Micrarchaeota archaeon]